ncbi:Nuclease S1 [Gluconacetobacter sp. SXCC-1]|nr:S1/P1 nuclease [Komagataeibacter rhaeticus]ATU72791.1 S1/P1 Nuclease [Komagataeibacter xylinus]EGG76493.1 Nuclease S1 [Gluconacetobacter sp. SXCC-1]WPP22567.1 S1/P1 nuclease [Komagataeibacter rhaeticus]SAY48631.1 S1/P1 Nuclease [Komagataeibacter rhaeticus]
MMNSTSSAGRAGRRRAGACLIGAALLGLSALPGRAHAWGVEGHEAVAALAWHYMTPDTRTKVDAILATDHDALTAPDFIARSTWADHWRTTGHPETGAWHFINMEIDHPDMASACQAPAQGGGQACVTSQLEHFEHVLSDPATTVADRAVALKYVIHFVGDMHQPLHAADHEDRGGNCVRISLGGARTTNLHSYWDTVVVTEIDPDARHLADRLFDQISVTQKDAWQAGTVAQWAMDSFGLAKTYVYDFHPPAGCSTDGAPLSLPAGYDATARAIATRQLEKAGVRLAFVLNRDLADVSLKPAR